MVREEKKRMYICQQCLYTRKALNFYRHINIRQQNQHQAKPDGHVCQTQKPKESYCSSVSSKKYACQHLFTHKVLPATCCEGQICDEKYCLSYNPKMTVPDRWTHQWCPTATGWAVPKALGRQHLNTATMTRFIIFYTHIPTTYLPHASVQAHNRKAGKWKEIVQR